MKTLKIRKDSLSYKLVTKVGDIRPWEFERGYIDSCQYNREIIKSFLLLILFVMSTLGASGFCFYMMGHTISWMISSIINWNFYLDEGPALGGLTIIISSSIVYAIYLYNKYSFILKRSTELKYKNESIEALKESFKEKFCRKIEITEEK